MRAVTVVRWLPDTPVMVMKGQVAKLSGFQEEVGTEMVGILIGLTMFTGGKRSAMSAWVNADTGRWKY